MCFLPPGISSLSGAQCLSLPSAHHRLKLNFQLSLSPHKTTHHSVLAGPAHEPCRGWSEEEEEEEEGVRLVP